MRLGVALSPGDLANIRFAVSAVHQTPGLITRWVDSREPARLIERHRARRELFQSSQSSLLELEHNLNGLPDFLAPVPQSGRSFNDELAAVANTPAETVEAQLSDGRGHLWWGSTDAFVANVVADIAALHRAVYEGRWRRTSSALQREIDRRAAQLARHGTAYVLNHLHPRLTFDGSTLWLSGPANTAAPSVLPNGRGIVFVPSSTWRMTFAARINDTDPLVLVYPIFAPNTPCSTAGGARALSRLLGGTRAQVLQAMLVADESTTGEIAGACDISNASASEHLTILRDAGLVASWRNGRHVRHTLTTLGRALGVPADTL
jgi:DNA-binding transcriptional ArsR family regulator